MLPGADRLYDSRIFKSAAGLLTTSGAMVPNKYSFHGTVKGEREIPNGIGALGGLSGPSRHVWLHNAINCKSEADPQPATDLTLHLLPA